MARASARGQRIKPVNRKFERCYHSRQRVQFVASLPCVICAWISSWVFGIAVAGHSHNAHVCGNGGRGRKKDYMTIAPLCAEHHRRYDERMPPCADPVMRKFVQDAAAITETKWQDFLRNKQPKTNGD